MKQQLFVYGTLCRAFNTPMSGLIDQHARFVSDAWIHGKLFEINGYPGVTLSDKPEDRVIGELFTLKQPDKLLTELDRYENCSPDYAKSPEYRRELVTVYTNHMTTEAWCYIYNLDTTALVQILSGDYRSTNTQQ